MAKFGNETILERRARLIFESEGHKGVAWNSIGTQEVRPDGIARIVIGSEAKEKYRQRARKELDPTEWMIRPISPR